MKSFGDWIDGDSINHVSFHVGMLFFPSFAAAAVQIQVSHSL